MINRVLVCALLLFAAVFGVAAADTTYVSGGHFTADSTWQASGSPYVILADITLNRCRLTVRPGVKVLFVHNAGLRVGRHEYGGYDQWAELYVVGKPDSMIVFTSLSDSANGWDGIYFHYMSDEYGATSLLEHCVIEKAGEGGWGVPANIYCDRTSQPTLHNCTVRDASQDGFYLSDSPLSIDSCAIEENGRDGISCNGSSPAITGSSITGNSRDGVHMISSSPVITGTRFENNTEYPIRIDLTSDPQTAGNTYVGNGDDAIGLSGGMLRADKTFYAHEVPYKLLEDFKFTNYSIYNNYKLTFLPGVTVACDSGVGIWVSSGYPLEFEALGTSDSLITFTSWSGSPGGWDGLYFSGSSLSPTSSMEYCIVENGGQDGWGQSANIYYNGGTPPSMSNCVVRNSAQDGLYLSSCSPTVTDCFAVGNSRHGVLLSASSPVITATAFESNGEYPIWMDIFSNPHNTGNTYTGNGIEAIAVDGGDLKSDKTFCADGEPYRLLSDLVFSNYTVYYTPKLSFMPSVTVLSDSAAGIWVRSGYPLGFQASGTSDSLITFTSWNGAPGGWDGLCFVATDLSPSSSMEYCVVENAGQDGWGQQANVFYDGISLPAIYNSKIRSSSQDGIYISSASPTITGTTFEGNLRYPIWMTIVSNPTLGGNSYTANGIQAIGQEGGNLQSNKTIYSEGVPYHILSDIFLYSQSVYNNPHFFVQPGATLAFDFACGLQIGSGSIYPCTFEAVGTSDSLITFTSWSGSQNVWDGIRFRKGIEPPSSLDYCVIENAGLGGLGADANLFYDNAVIPPLANCIIRRSGGRGIYLENASPSIRNTAIIDNSSYGVYCEGSSSPTIGDTAGLTCELHGNDDYAIYVNGPSDVNSRHNFWGAVDSAEIEEIIFDQVDDSSRGRVHFVPWVVLNRDVRATKILSPVDVVPESSIIAPQAEVQNVGHLPAVAFPVVFKIGSDYCDTGHVTGLLHYGELDTVTFREWTATLNKSTSYTTMCSTALEGDMYSRNDTVDGIVTVGTSYEPAIFAIDPSVGGNIGDVQVTITGERFQQGLTLRLTKEGEPDILVDSLGIIVRDSTELHAIVDLFGATTGVWNVAVINPDSSSAIFENSFGVEPGLTNPWLDITGRDVILSGSPAPFQITCGNSGNVDILGAFVWLNLPAEAELEIDLPPTWPDTADTVVETNRVILPKSFNADSTELFGGVLIPYLPAGQSVSFGLTVTLTSPPQTWFALRAQIFELPAPVPDTLYQDTLLLPYHQSEFRSSSDLLDSRGPNAPFLRSPQLTGEPRSEEPKNGYLVFRCWNTDCTDVGHVGIVAVEGDPPKAYVYDAVRKRQPDGRNTRRRELEDWISEGPGTFKGVFPPPDYDEGKGLLMAMEAKRIHDYELWAYWAHGFPWFPYAGNCGHFTRKCLMAGGEESNAYDEPFCIPRRAWRRLIGRAGIWGNQVSQEYEEKAFLELYSMVLGLIYDPLLWSWQRMLIEVRASWDPNDKVAPEGFDTTFHYKSPNDLFTYVVFFENDTSATADARNILIVDTLDANLNWNTLELGAVWPDSSDPNRPDSFTYWSDFDPSEGVITWTFENIMLPPDTLPPSGEGWVTFSIMPWNDLESGTQISNIVGIKFDANPWFLAPMDSLPVINTIDAFPPMSHVAALADTQEELSFEVCWSGEDDSLGSGVKDYTIFVSVDGGFDSIWIAHTTDTCATFAGEVDREYCFYSNARDNVLNVETGPVSPDACTRTPIYICGDCNADSVVNLGDVVYLISYLYRGGPPPQPIQAGDVNKDVVVDIGDVVYLVNYLYRNGPEPCPPEGPLFARSKPEPAEVWLRTTQTDGRGVSVYVDAKFDVHVAGAHLEIGWDEEKLDLLKALPTERSQKLQLYATATTGEAKLGIVDIEGKEFVKPGEGSLIEFKMRSKTDSVDLTGLQIKQAILVDPSARKLDVKILGKADDVNLPKQFSLSQNYPNPFNPTTVIQYALPRACEVQITVYNILGQRVRSLVDQHQDAGYKRIEWDSKNQGGHEVASGIYFYRIKAGEFADSKKMVILK